jgi:hypothetical protein
VRLQKRESVLFRDRRIKPRSRLRPGGSRACGHARSSSPSPSGGEDPTWPSPPRERRRVPDDQRALCRSDVEALLVGLRDGDLEALTDRLPALTGGEPAAHEGAVSLSGQTVGPRQRLCARPSLRVAKAAKRAAADRKSTALGAPGQIEPVLTHDGKQCLASSPRRQRRSRREATAAWQLAYSSATRIATANSCSRWSNNSRRGVFASGSTMSSWSSATSSSCGSATRFRKGTQGLGALTRNRVRQARPYSISRVRSLL